ncbi:MAG: hypothetical protein ACRDPC_02210, partial [Solirubrobacteraceae bacterium]
TRTLALAGLGEADVARFIELTAPGAPAADLSAAVHAGTDGNPLFVGEVVRLLAAERGLDEPAMTPLAIPESVRDVIGRRLRHLSDECNRLLANASVLGREFDLDALTGVSGLERGAILALLDEGIEARRLGGSWRDRPYALRPRLDPGRRLPPPFKKSAGTAPPAGRRGARGSVLLGS